MIRHKEQVPVIKLILLYLAALFPTASWAMEINACKDQIGTWEITMNN